MKSKLCSITLFAAIAVSFLMNFDPFFWAGSATVWNLLLTVGYLAAWGWFLHEKCSKMALWFYRIWWTLALTGVILWFGLQWMILPDFLFIITVPLLALLLSELFGVSILFPDAYMLEFLLYAVISGVMLWLGIRKMKREILW